MTITDEDVYGHSQEGRKSFLKTIVVDHSKYDHARLDRNDIGSVNGIWKVKFKTKYQIIMKTLKDILLGITKVFIGLIAIAACGTLAVKICSSIVVYVWNLW